MCSSDTRGLKLGWGTNVLTSFPSLEYSLGACRESHEMRPDQAHEADYVAVTGYMSMCMQMEMTDCVTRGL